MLHTVIYVYIYSVLTSPSNTFWNQVFALSFLTLQMALFCVWIILYINKLYLDMEDCFNIFFNWVIFIKFCWFWSPTSKLKITHKYRKLHSSTNIYEIRVPLPSKDILKISRKALRLPPLHSLSKVFFMCV